MSRKLFIILDKILNLSNNREYEPYFKILYSETTVSLADVLNHWAIV